MDKNIETIVQQILREDLVGSHTEAISLVAISPSNKAIYHLWDIALLQYEKSWYKWICFVNKWYNALLLGGIETGDIASAWEPAYRNENSVQFVPYALTAEQKEQRLNFFEK